MRRDAQELLDQLAPLETAALVERMNIALIEVDSQWTVRHCNDAYLAWAGLPREAVIGHTPFEYHPAFERSIFYGAFERCLTRREPVVQVGHSTMFDGRMHMHALPLPDGGAAMLAFRMSTDSIHQYLVGERAITDSLTRLPNQHALIEDLRQQTGEEREICLTIVAIERLNRIQDALGYEGVEQALLEIASRVLGESRGDERVYRIGGHDFAVLASDSLAVGLSPEERGVRARVRAAAYIAAIEQPVVVRGQRHRLGATAGCDLVGRAGDAPEATIQRAALALQHARRVNPQGNGIAVHDAELHALITDQAELEVELNAAIAADALHLEFQPKGDLRRGGIVGAEALIRWDHPTRGRLPPGKFLPLAEEAGLMPEIDRLVIRQSIAALKDMDRRGIGLTVSINLSVHTLGDESLAATLRDALDGAGLPPERLEIEIPENALMADVERSARLLAQARKHGMRVSIDDFGTGYSSLAYLARFPVNALKIDRSFVRGIDQHPANLKIVRGIAQLAASMQLEVVAEGAETETETAMVRALGCDSVQGFGYARPMPYEIFIAFCERERHPQGRPDPRSI